MSDRTHPPTGHTQGTQCGTGWHDVINLAMLARMQSQQDLPLLGGQQQHHAQRIALTKESVGCKSVGSSWTVSEYQPEPKVCDMKTQALQHVNKVASIHASPHRCRCR